jgi:hypothetical protein
MDIHKLDKRKFKTCLLKAKFKRDLTDDLSMVDLMSHDKTLFRAVVDYILMCFELKHVKYKGEKYHNLHSYIHDDDSEDTIKEKTRDERGVTMCNCGDVGCMDPDFETADTDCICGHKNIYAKIIPDDYDKDLEFVFRNTGDYYEFDDSFDHRSLGFPKYMTIHYEIMDWLSHIPVDVASGILMTKDKVKIVSYCESEKVFPNYDHCVIDHCQINLSAGPGKRECYVKSPATLYNLAFAIFKVKECKFKDTGERCIGITYNDTKHEITIRID